MGHNWVGNLGVGTSRLVNKLIEVMKERGETKAETGKNHHDDHRQLGRDWCREHQTIREHYEE